MKQVETLIKILFEFECEFAEGASHVHKLRHAAIFLFLIFNPRPQVVTLYQTFSVHDHIDKIATCGQAGKCSASAMNNLEDDICQ